jgi:hypothetical protein
MSTYSGIYVIQHMMIGSLMNDNGCLQARLLETPTSLLMELPLEMRRITYRHTVAATELEIGERWILRRHTTTTRYNRYTLANAKHNRFALLGTCTQIRDDIQHFGVLTELLHQPRLWKVPRLTIGLLCCGRDKIDDYILVMLKRPRSIDMRKILYYQQIECGEV